MRQEMAVTYSSIFRTPTAMTFSVGAETLQSSSTEATPHYSRARPSTFTRSSSTSNIRGKGKRTHSSIGPVVNSSVVLSRTWGNASGRISWPIGVRRVVRVFAAGRLAKDFHTAAKEIDDPVVGNAGGWVQVGFFPHVVVEARVGDFDQ